MEKLKTNKGIKGFIKCCGICSVVFLIVLIIALSVFWKYLDCYQKSDSLIPVNNFIQLIKRSNFKVALEVSDKTGVFEDENQFAVFISENFPKGFEDLKVVRVGNSDNAVYEIYNDSDDKVFTLNVGQSDKEIGFGIKESAITEIKVGTIDSIGITVPNGAIVYVNGTVLDKNTAKDVNVTQIFNNIPTETMPKMQRYITEGHLVYPDISVVYNKEIINDDQTTSEKEIICKAINDNAFDLIYVNDCSETDYPEVALKALDSAKNYESFLCRGLHKNYLLRHIYPESDFYDEIKEFDNSQMERQYGISFSDGKYNSIYVLDDYHYIVNVKISKTYKTANETKVDTKEYVVYILNVDGKLVTTDIIIK